MGGWDSVGRTTETITEEDNSGVPGFPLKYNTV